jgi:hypothetical protein
MSTGTAWITRLVAAIAAGAFYMGERQHWFKIDDDTWDRIATGYGAMASIAGALLGFSIAAVSILIGLLSAPRFVALRESPSYQDLWSAFHFSSRALAFATLACLVGLLVPSKGGAAVLVLALSIYGTLAATIALVRSIWIFEKVVNISAKPSPTSSSLDAALKGDP